MGRIGIRLFICVVAMSSLVHAQSPVARPRVQKQRVSPKLLREAMNVQEFQVRTQQSQPPVSLDELKALADKLQANGETQGAELLNRFVREHQPQVAAMAYPGADQERFDLLCDVVEVNLNDIAQDSPLTAHNCSEHAQEALRELEQLLHSHKATAVIKHVLVPVQAFETGRARSGGGVAVPVPSADGSTAAEFRHVATIVDASAAPLTKDRVRVQLSCMTRTKDQDNSVTSADEDIPGTTTHKLQTVVDTDLGATIVQALPGARQGFRQFVLLKVTRQN